MVIHSGNGSTEERNLSIIVTQKVPDRSFTYYGAIEDMLVLTAKKRPRTEMCFLDDVHTKCFMKANECLLMIPHHATSTVRNLRSHVSKVKEFIEMKTCHDAQVVIFLNKVYFDLYEKIAVIRAFMYWSTVLVITWSPTIAAIYAQKHLPIHFMPFAVDQNAFTLTKIAWMNRKYDVYFSGDKNPLKYPMRNDLTNAFNAVKDLTYFEPSVRLDHNQYLDAFANAKIVISTPGFPSKYDLIGTRHFEVLATNTTLLLCEFSPVYEQLGIIHNHTALIFSTIDQAISLARHYTKNAHDALRIVHNAHRLVVDRHTWQHRINTILSLAKNNTSIATTSLNTKGLCGACGSTQTIILHSWHLSTPSAILNDLVDTVLKPHCNLHVYSGFKMSAVPNADHTCRAFTSPIHNVPAIVSWLRQQPQGTAKFIYTLRNPFDMVFSIYLLYRNEGVPTCSKKYFGDVTMAKLLGPWLPELRTNQFCYQLSTLPIKPGLLKTAQRLLDHLFPQMIQIHHTALLSKDAIALRYEDLVGDSQKVSISSLFKAIGLTNTAPISAFSFYHPFSRDKLRDASGETTIQYNRMLAIIQSTLDYCNALLNISTQLGYCQNFGECRNICTTVTTDRTMHKIRKKKKHDTSKMRIRMTITYLITLRGYLRQWDFSLPLLNANWLVYYPTPVTVFFSGGLRADDIENVARGAGPPAIDLHTYFIGNLAPPSYLDQVKANGDCVCCCNGLARSKPGIRGGQYNIGYCMMNRFRTLLMYKHKALRDYDYFIQLDTDTYIKKRMPYNPVEYCHKNNIILGFLVREIRGNSLENDCRRGLSEALQSYLDKYGIIPVYEPSPGTQYTGNFWIADLRYFRSEQYYAASRWINNQFTGVFTERWGDQLYVPNIIGFHYNQSAIHEFTDLITSGFVEHLSEKVAKISE